MRTILCDLVNIEVPIFQGGMAWLATGELAAAVSSAGGLGIIGAGNASPEIVLSEIKKVKQTTDKPFGVNVYYMSSFVEEIVDLVCQERIAVVTTGAGNPGKHIKKFKDAGVKVFPVVSSVALAKRLERQGVDGIIAEGMECGGHIGEVTTVPLVPQVVDAVDVPVIAAGGIADGRGFAAALALGAVGAQIGTRFICASECSVHQNYKEAVLKAKDRDTVVTGYQGHYVRVLNNKLAREFKKLESRGAPAEEFERLGAGRLRSAVIEGDIQYGSVMAGQVAAMVDQVLPVSEIMDEIIKQAEATIRELTGLLQGGA